MAFQSGVTAVGSTPHLALTWLVAIVLVACITLFLGMLAVEVWRSLQFARRVHAVRKSSGGAAPAAGHRATRAPKRPSTAPAPGAPGAPVAADEEKGDAQPVQSLVAVEVLSARAELGQAGVREPRKECCAAVRGMSFSRGLFGGGVVGAPRRVVGHRWGGG
jgi:hypothetical protein